MKRPVLLVIGGLLAVGLGGCMGEDNGPPPPKPPSQSQIDATIKTIQDNPNMPQAAKDQAIASYKAGMARMGAGGPAPGTTTPPPGK